MTTNFWIGLSVAVFFVLASLLAIAASFLVGEQSYYGGSRRTTFYPGVIVGAVALTVTVVGSLFGFYPYKAEYHSWRSYEGTVASINSRIVGGSDSVNQKFVVRFQGSDQLYGVNDTRAATLRKGDHLSILCQRSHQWGGGVDGYDCRWNQ